MQNKRYHLLDNWRGLIIISMILYHGTWDMIYMFQYKIPWYEELRWYIWQQSICWSFIFLSGICWSLGKHPIRRGLIVFAAGLVVTWITHVFMPDARITFGVLTFLGAAMLLTSLLDSVLQNENPYLGILCSLALFFLLRNINQGTFGFEKWSFGQVDPKLYQGWFMTFLGFPKAGFFSTDYFSFIPWYFLFLAGYYFYGIMEQKQWLDKLTAGEHTPFAWLGKHSLIIYLIHQPVLYGLLTLF